MFDTIRSFFTTPPKRPSSPLGAGLSDQDESAIPAFQQAWKEGATFDDLFGPQPFALHGSIGRSGADNHRPDVAKVETLLGDAGYYKPLTSDGPSGWHSTNLDSAIRNFQKDHGLEVDGVLKPGGPTIGKLGSLLGGGAPAKPDASQPPTREGFGGQSDMVRDLPWPKPKPPAGMDDIATIRWKPQPHTTVPDRFPGHTISEAGAKEHDDWAKLLVRDSDPSQTARMLKVAIDESGDQGRGDVADLLGRFHQIDPAKAKILHRVLKDSTGEDLPFRVAPLGEGFRELTDEEKLATAPNSPFGSAHGADTWAAGNMAEVLLGKGDYADAIKHFRTDQSATMPYLAAVHAQMRDKNPMAAMKFATQMQKAGLAMAADAPEPPVPTMPPVTQPPVTNPPETTTPAPTPEPTPLAPEKTQSPQTSPPQPLQTSSGTTEKPSHPPIQPPPSSSTTEAMPGGQINWKPDKGMMSSGDHVTRVNGPIRIDQHSITPGLDGIRYHVEWFPLDENGNVAPHIRNSGKGKEFGGNILPGVTGEMHKPPYDNPHGWEVKVSIPPQFKYNNLSGKPWLSVQIPSTDPGRR